MVSKRHRVAFITPMDPFGVGGGAISARRYMICLELLKKEERIEDFLAIYLKKSKLDTPKNEARLCSYDRRYIRSFMARLRLFASPLELKWKKIISTLIDFKPTVILIHFSTLGNLLEKIRKKFSNTLIIQNFDNFEFINRSVASRVALIARAEQYLAYKSERKCLKLADKFIFLTEEEAQSIMDFYGIKKDYIIIPFTMGFCAVSNNKSMNWNKSKKLTLLFTGSLNYLPNIDGVRFLIKIEAVIKTRLEKLGYSDFQIIIAGSSPPESIINSCFQCRNIVLVPNPTNLMLENIFKSADLYISPVFSGTGVNVKILEALYHGLPILSSSHSLKGYVPGLEPLINKYVFQFNDRDEASFISSLSEALSVLNNEHKNRVYSEIAEFYNKVYSPLRIKDLLGKFMLE